MVLDPALMHSGVGSSTILSQALSPSRAVVELRVRLAGVLDQAQTIRSRGPGLANAILENPSQNLAQLFHDLPSDQQRQVATQIGAANLRVILNLSTESQLAIFQRDFMGLARRLEGSSNPFQQSMALPLYQSLVADDSELGREAGARLAALRGEGAWGRRAEIFGRQFFRQVSDPAMLVSLGIGSGVFKSVYAGVLPRLLPSARGAVGLGQLWGARAFAGSLALGAEVPAWVLSEHALRHAMGQSVDWSPVALQTHLLSGYITLGSLHSFGALGRSLSGARLVGRRSFNQVLMPQASMLGGIQTAFLLEERLGLRENHGAGSRWFDSLAFLVQAQTAGHLSSHLLGRSWARFQQGLDLRIQQAQAGFRLPSVSDISLKVPLGLDFSYGSIGRGQGLPMRTPAEPLASTIMMSQGLRPAQATDRITDQRLEQLSRPTFTEETYQHRDAPRETSSKAKPRVAVLTSGGDGPAENAAIQALVEGAIGRGWSILGIREGFRGLLAPELRVFEFDSGIVQGEAAVRLARQMIYGRESLPMRPEHRQDIKFVGGNILKSSRHNPVVTTAPGEFNIDRVQATLRSNGIDALVVMGGNGSQRAARDLANLGVPVVFMPQTIDADVPGSRISIGFPSAVNEGAAGLPKFLNTAHSCNRWFLVEIMGQHYGLLPLAIGRNASLGRYSYDGFEQGPPLNVLGVFNEVPRSMHDITRIIESSREQGLEHGALLISEGVVFNEGTPGRAVDANNRLEIKSGDIARWLQGRLSKAPYNIGNTKDVSIGYSMRGAEPTIHDIQLAEHLSRGALELIEGGSFGRMVGVDFLGESARLAIQYPSLEQAVRQQVMLEPRYTDYVGRLLLKPHP